MLEYHLSDFTMVCMLVTHELVCIFLALLIYYGLWKSEAKVNDPTRLIVYSNSNNLSSQPCLYNHEES